MRPLFISVLGAPACGKSYFLTTMTWELRNTLPSRFMLSFTDTDPGANEILNGYEDLLFQPEDASRFTAIQKTQLEGDLYDTVSYGEQTVSYPRPFLFTIRPRNSHPNRAAVHENSRVLCLYDNAGEHFQPGADTTATPVTRHMAQSRLLMYLFDPTQDPRFREECRGHVDDPQLDPSVRTGRQVSILSEAVDRIRKYRGLPQGARHGRPLIVVPTKYDTWKHLTDIDLEAEYLKVLRDGGRSGPAAIDLDRVETVSNAVREVILRLCPEVVNTAEDFSTPVVYLPVSALGRSPSRIDAAEELVIRPKDVKPQWVTIPILYALSRWGRGLVPRIRKGKVQLKAASPQSAEEV